MVAQWVTMLVPSLTTRIQSLDPRGGRRDSILASCPLTYTHIHN